MLASLNWLRELCPVEESAERIARALTDRGLTVDSVREVQGDVVLEIDVPANRPDCLGHLGLAREIGAAFDTPRASADESGQAHVDDVSEVVSVRIEAPDHCPRYSARVVREVRVAASPAWVAARLEACGLRPISNVVDISNLVLLQLGQPIHFFDLSRLAGPAIVVRMAGEGEALKTLDGVERRLAAEDLVIADLERAVALAGVIGGADTEIGETTSDVLIEAASFDPLTVRRTGRRLGIQTDAGHRFERGVDPEAVLAAQSLAVRLLVDLAGGTAVEGTIDVHPRPREAARIQLRESEIERLLGYRPAPAETEAALAAVDLAPQRIGPERVEVRVPSFRVDLAREADLVEEVARHLGYERVPVRAPETRQAQHGESERSAAGTVRDVLAGGGFHEAVGYAMIGDGDDSRFVRPGAPPPIALSNPIADWLAVLRRSLVPGLLRAADLNFRRGVVDVRLFEVGHVFHASVASGFPEEPLHAALVWSGTGEPAHWSATGRPLDLFDVTGRVEQLIESLSPGCPLQRGGDLPSGFHPGVSASWVGDDGVPRAWCGALHPDLQSELSQPVFLAEIYVGALARDPRHTPSYVPVPKLTPVTRDLALVMNEKTSWAAVREVLDAIEAPAPVEIRPVDRYEGPPLASGESSLTVRVELRPAERTLTDEEIDGYRGTLIRELERRLSIEIRG